MAVLFLIGYQISQIKVFQSTQREESLLGEISVRENDVRLKQPGSISWSFRDSQIFNRSTVYIGKESFAEIALGEDKIIVDEDDTILYFEETQDELEIHLHQGSIKYLKRKKISKSVKKKVISLVTQKKRTDLTKSVSINSSHELSPAKLLEPEPTNQFNLTVVKPEVFFQKGSLLNKEMTLDVYTHRRRQTPIFSKKRFNPARDKMIISQPGKYYFRLTRKNKVFGEGKFKVPGQLKKVEFIARDNREDVNDEEEISLEQVENLKDMDSIQTSRQEKPLIQVVDKEAAKLSRSSLSKMEVNGESNKENLKKVIVKEKALSLKKTTSKIFNPTPTPQSIKTKLPDGKINPKINQKSRLLEKRTSKEISDKKTPQKRDSKFDAPKLDQELDVIMHVK